MIGFTIIIILLVPIIYQVVTLQMKQDRRHKELLEILQRMEENNMS